MILESQRPPQATTPRPQAIKPVGQLPLRAWVLFVAIMVAIALVSECCAAPPSGYGMLQGGSRNNALTNAQFNHPKLSFFVLRDRCAKQNPRLDHYDFTYNANQIRRCRKAGKGYIVAPMTGAGATPDFVAGPRFKNNKNETVIAPWSPAIADWYARYIYAQANTEVDGLKVKDDPLCLCPWVTGPTVPSQELHLNGLEKAPGYSPAGIVANWKACIKATHAAFPNKPAILSLSGQTAVLKYQPQIIAAMKAEYGRDAIFQHNSMGTQTNVNADHHRILLDLQREGHWAGTEMVKGGQVAGLGKFPTRKYAVLYPGDERSVK